MKIALLCLAMLGVSCSAFLVPQGSFVQVAKQGRQRASIQVGWMFTDIGATGA